MFKTFMGPVEDTASQVYIRPETAQGIYVNYLNVQSSSRLQVPFGIAQIGKAFRNEIKPGNFIFRTCEFEQMEMQFFVKPGTDDRVDGALEGAAHGLEYDKRLGIRPENLRFHQHGPGELAHYAKDAWDVEFQFPFGWKEIEGIHNRTDFDLRAPPEFSARRWITSTAAAASATCPTSSRPRPACDRTLLTFLCDAYREDVIEDEERVVLRLPPEPGAHQGRRAAPGEEGRHRRDGRGPVTTSAATGTSSTTSPAPSAALPPDGRGGHALVHHHRHRDALQRLGDGAGAGQPSAGARQPLGTARFP
jgi:glycyl-tRNA synthetase (class II)